MKSNGMKALEKAKIALRKHLLVNKEQVKIDLEEMRKKSEGNDIFSYINRKQLFFILRVMCFFNCIITRDNDDY